MGLGRRHAHRELAGDLGVGQPCAISVSTSRSRAVSRASASGGGRSGSGWLAKCAISRRVTFGASSASPAAMTRTADSSSSAGVP